METITILLYGEGPTDYAKKNQNNVWEPGPVAYLIQKCSEEVNVPINLEFVEKSKIDGKGKLKFGQKSLKGLQGKAIPARRFQVYAKQMKYKYGIFYCDTDKVKVGSNTDERTCRKQFQNVYDEVEKGLESDKTDWKAIPMIALKMIESWLLADEGAYIKIFQNKPLNPSLPKKPELIWGEKEDSNSGYPKNYMNRILKQYNKQSGFETFNTIAQETNVSVLRKKCEISFGRFYSDFETIIK